MKKTGILIALITWFNFGLFAQSKVEIHQIDVGTGDAALINIMDNSGTGTVQYSILIDGGETNMQESVILYLESFAKNQGGKVYLDYVLTSHYHSDHIGGFVGQKVSAIPTSSRKKMKCTPFYTGVLGYSARVAYFAVLDKGNSAPVPSSTTPAHKPTLYAKYKTLADSRRKAVGELSVGQFGALATITPSGVYPPPIPTNNQKLALGGTIELGQDANGTPVRLRLILADSKVYLPGAPTNTYNTADTILNNTGVNPRNNRKNENNWGLGWVLEYGAFRWYTAGDVGGYNGSYGTCTSCGSSYFDIETPISLALPAIYPSPANAQGHICSQKISHHGSCCSSNPTLLQTMKCSSAIFSSGPSSGFGHPTQEVIDRVEAAHWKCDSLPIDSTVAYRITELFFEDRNINLAIGNTSGNRLLVATDLVVPLADIDTAYIMNNGNSIYSIDDTFDRLEGDIIIKVQPTNNGFPIALRSYYTLEYTWYDGTVLTKDIFCHGQ